MRKFTYLTPRSLDEAISLHASHQGRARYIAGGTDILVKIKERKEAPDYLIHFFLGSGQTVLEKGEILTELAVPPLLPPTGSVHIKFGRRFNPIQQRGHAMQKTAVVGKRIPKLDAVDKATGRSRYGAKGIGEPGCVPTAPAVANAVYDAIGIRIKYLPITSEKVLAAIKESKRRRK